MCIQPGTDAGHIFRQQGIEEHNAIFRRDQAIPERRIGTLLQHIKQTDAEIGLL